MSPRSPFSDNRIPLSLAGGLLIVVCGYALFVATPYLLGPSLTIDSPISNSHVESDTVTIAGTAERVSYLSVNGMPVPISVDGSFSIVRGYPAGYTVLVVRARDRFNREVVKTVPFIHALTTNHI